MFTKKISKEDIKEFAWLGVKINKRTIPNPLLDIPKELEESPALYLLFIMQRPEYFSFICESVFNVKLLPIQAVILQQMWTHKLPMLIGSRGLGKSFLLAVYSLLRMVLLPRRKVVICGAGFRQSKIIFGYMETIWKNSPILRDMYPDSDINGPKHNPEMWEFTLGESTAKAIPIGNGGSIRGLRANDIIADEFATIPRDVFETVIKGFNVVNADIVESVQRETSKRIAKHHGVELDASPEDVFDKEKDNQLIISGTAYYDFNHFAEYYRRYHKILQSRGDEHKLLEIFPDGVPAGFNWTDHAIIRIPFELMPPGFMDEAMVSSSRATSTLGIYQMEYGAVFAKDSYGFFRRSLIERCTLGPDNEIRLPSGPVMFTATTKGNKESRYVFGVDPASESDKLSIVIVEIKPDHRRIVYVWTTNRKEFSQKLRAGLVKESDYYGYCARKLRDLMKTFPCERIALDWGGGGVAIYEALHDLDKLEEGELPIYEIIDPENPKDSDIERGLHIIEKINFRNTQWVIEANHGLKKDMEDGVLIFPYFDTATLEMAAVDDAKNNVKHDTLEDCIMEIEELKNELTTITHTQSTNGTDKWDTPEVKLAGMKKGRLRKDRYSGLLMANMSARCIERKIQNGYQYVDGTLSTKRGETKAAFNGPAWLTDAFNNLYK